MINNYSDQPYDRCEKWAEDIGVEIDDLSWYQSINDSYACTSSITLRSFMYKFALRVIYPNSKLFKMNLLETPLCPKCKIHEDTIMHMFWYCDSTQKLLQDLMIWMYEILKRVHLNPLQWLLYVNLNIDISFYKVVVLILTLYKYCVCIQKQRVKYTNIIRRCSQRIIST